MWNVVKLVEGEWQILAEEQDIEAATEMSTPTSDNDIFIFPSEIDPDKESDILSMVERVNSEKIIRVTYGASVEKIEGLSSCPGRCFCVIAHGQRRCEVYYCNASGWCWWVGCGYNC